ncbi:LysR family transcriptional regulator [Alisedimentitalea sp. MJ-SS2]|uniref:LysR family transcriptional regulator n=1 Tax=Aliisedimentitalea sp. MJ-SS2 TaxID=3049795 RepID=UPI00291403B5|nr:LysR family transcriptional regulator [Alisedimentitalea sp. MJ-SS2]MDU8929640.1 LysR family transcriptional regulator [Alisedimentitalea sp. MJ-SS2]
MGQLEDLRAFVQIVENESIGKAADQSGIAKSAMSRKLRLLEERLQTELIVRTTRQWALTAAGRAYFAHAQKIIAAIEEADAEIANEEVEASGEIRLSAPLHYGTSVLAPRLMGFMDKHPNIGLFVDFNDRFVDIIGEHFDLAVRISNLQDSSIIARKLAQTQHVFCASPDYLGSTPPIARPDDLKSHNILQFGASKRFKWTFTLPEGGEKSVALKSTFNANNGDMLLCAAMRGKGVARLPDFLASDAIAAGDLQRILLGWEPERLPVNLVYPATHFLPHRVRLLIDFLVEGRK